MRASITPQMFEERYASVFGGDERWRAVPTTHEVTYNWDQKSTYVKLPPYFDGLTMEPGVVDRRLRRARAREARRLGDDRPHLSGRQHSPERSGRVATSSTAGVDPKDFNSYGTRRGNYQVMMRGTFANIRLRNLMAPGTEGGVTIKLPEGTPMSIFDAAMAYAEEGTPLVILGGKEYGSGSSRDWAAKGTKLLGVRAVLVESFERIHRSNLVGMGVLPLQFLPGESAETHGLDGTEVFSITGLEPLNHGETVPTVTVHVTRENGDDVRLRSASTHRHAHRGRVLPPRRRAQLRASPTRGELSPTPARTTASSTLRIRRDAANRADRRTWRASSFTPSLTRAKDRLMPSIRKSS